MLSLLSRVVEALQEPWVDEPGGVDDPYRAHASEYSSFVQFFQGMTVSAAAHAALVAALGQWMLPPKPPEEPPDLAWKIEEPEEEPEPEVNYTVADASDEPSDSVFAAAAMSMAPVENLANELRSVTRPTEVEAAIELLATALDLEGFQVDDVVVRTGTVGQELLQVDGAVDRLTEEILNNLSEHKLLVVWLMDASLSLVADRQAVADRLQHIYHELDETGGVSDEGLKSAVVAYGQRAIEMTPPTTDAAAVVAAIRAVPNDESGIENVFSTVLWSAMRYKHERVAEHRRLMFVIWTDESGNDANRLDEAVRVCETTATPVYIVGPSAMFGQEKGTMPYKHVDGKVYQLPVDRGPDTVREERLHLPYWFDGPQYETLHSGLGPFALTRLAHATGGAYFIKDAASDRSPFPVETMQRYIPDYDTPGLYLRQAANSPLRRAVLTAVDMTRQRKLKGTPRLRFAPNGRTFFNELREAQETVAYNTPILQQALAAFGPKGQEQAYVREPSARWRAWYDLTYGRLLAMAVRANEYNWACAVMKGKGADFVDKKSNRWQFVPDKELHFGSQSERQAKEATRLLTRCVQENSGTPWAVLAQRELAQPFGFRVIEAYEPPPPPPPKPKPGAPPPPPPPPSNERRSEQARKLPKPVEVPLPKL